MCNFSLTPLFISDFVELQFVSKLSDIHSIGKVLAKLTSISHYHAVRLLPKAIRVRHAPLECALYHCYQQQTPVHPCSEDTFRTMMDAKR